MPFPVYSGRNNFRGTNCRSIVTAFSIAVCIRIWITGSISLAETDKLYGHWLRTYAVVVGSVDKFAYGNGDNTGNNHTVVEDTSSSTNITSTVDTGSNSSQQNRVTTYCALLNYTTAGNEPVTSMSTYASSCSTTPPPIPIGETFEIRYNPDNPKEFILQVNFAEEITSLSTMIGIGFSLTVLLLYFVCRARPEDHGQHQHSFDGFGGTDEELGHPNESPEERRERILSKMIFQTVLEDLSNTTTEQMRALEAEAGTKGTNMEEVESGNEETNLEEKQPADKATNGIDPNEEKADIEGEKVVEEFKEAKEGKVTTNGESQKTEEMDENQNDNMTTKNSASLDENDDTLGGEHHPGNGLLQMFSSWRRPEGEAECCICLDKYEPGETICASKNPECTHVFHKDCVMDWLMKNHNQCPLCRTDLLK